MDEEKNTQGEEQEVKSKDNDDGIQSEADKKVAELNADTERINKAIAENENAKARERLSGTAEAGIKSEAKKEETPEEYAEKVRKGEVNPLAM